MKKMMTLVKMSEILSHKKKYFFFTRLKIFQLVRNTKNQSNALYYYKTANVTGSLDFIRRLNITFTFHYT